MIIIYTTLLYGICIQHKNVGHILDDAEDYKLGFLFENPLDYMPGHIVYNQEEFIGFIKDVIDGKDPHREERQKISNLFFEYHDGNGSKRLAEYLGLKK